MELVNKNSIAVSLVLILEFVQYKMAQEMNSELVIYHMPVLIHPVHAGFAIPIYILAKGVDGRTLSGIPSCSSPWGLRTSAHRVDHQYT